MKQQFTFRFSDALLVTYLATTRVGEPEHNEPKTATEIEITNAIALTSATDSPELMEACWEHFAEQARAMG